MAPNTLITAAEVCQKVGITRRQLDRQVAWGTIAVKSRIGNTRLFHPSVIEILNREFSSSRVQRQP
jgi:DNA-binding transcriptional MerR regulator